MRAVCSGNHRLTITTAARSSSCRSCWSKLRKGFPLVSCSAGDFCVCEACAMKAAGLA